MGIYPARCGSGLLTVPKTMSSVREKLADYRQSKAKEKPSQPHKEEEAVSTPITSASTDSEDPIQAHNEVNVSSGTPDSRGTGPLGTALKLGLWFLLWGISIECGFGVVYVILSGLVLMAYSLYGSRRPRHEPSAYSVFNKDCESIDGTLTAEQFERELRYGPTNVRQ